MEQPNFPHDLELRDPPELGWQKHPRIRDIGTIAVKSFDIAPGVRHINRVRQGMQWLGPAIEKPKNLR